MMKRIETRLQMLADRPEWLRSKGPFPIKAFYHGTAAELEPGEIITPLNEPSAYEPYWETDPGMEDPQGYGFATSDIDIARIYAEHHAMNNTWERGARYGYIYEVEPVNPDWAAGYGTTKEEDSAHGHHRKDVYHEFAGEYISQSGWRVIRLVETVVI